MAKQPTKQDIKARAAAEERTTEALAKVTDLTVNEHGSLIPRTYEGLWKLAQQFAASALVPKSYQAKPMDVLVAMQYAAELRLSPLQAIQNIAVINGRPSIWGDLLPALIMREPDFEDLIEECDGKVAVCTVCRRGREPVVRTFSVEDAQIAGLYSKDGVWKQYPKRMLQMRARAFAIRDAFPDVLKGIAVAEEQQDVIDVTPQAAPVSRETTNERARSAVDRVKANLGVGETVRPPAATKVRPSPQPETKPDAEPMPAEFDDGMPAWDEREPGAEG